MLTAAINAAEGRPLLEPPPRETPSETELKSAFVGGERETVLLKGKTRVKKANAL